MKIRALIGIYKVGVKIIRIELASGKPVVRRQRNIFFIAVCCDAKDKLKIYSFYKRV